MTTIQIALVIQSICLVIQIAAAIYINHQHKQVKAAARKLGIDT